MSTDADITDAELQVSAIHGGGLATAAQVKSKRTAGAARLLGPAVVFGLFIGFWYFTHHVLMSASKQPLVPVPHDVVARRAGDPVSTYANPDHALATLGWQAQHGLEAIVKTAYDWHVSQLDGTR